MKPMLNYRPPWYSRLFTRENLKTVTKWLLFAAFVLWIVWPDSREREIVREVNDRAAFLVENYDKLTREEIIAELEEIKTLTHEPEPEPDDPH